MKGFKGLDKYGDVGLLIGLAIALVLLSYDQLRKLPKSEYG